MILFAYRSEYSCSLDIFVIERKIVFWKRDITLSSQWVKVRKITKHKMVFRPMRRTAIMHKTIDEINEKTKVICPATYSWCQYTNIQDCSLVNN